MYQGVKNGILPLFLNVRYTYHKLWFLGKFKKVSGCKKNVDKL